MTDIVERLRTMRRALHVKELRRSGTRDGNLYSEWGATVAFALIEIERLRRPSPTQGEGESDVARCAPPGANVTAQSTWRPIETAPRDGTPVDLWTTSRTCMRNIRWLRGAEVDPRAAPGGIWAHLAMDGWRGPNPDDVGCGCLSPDQFTHWRHPRPPLVEVGPEPSPESRSYADVDDTMWIGVNSRDVPDVSTLHVDERDCQELIDAVVYKDGEVFTPRRCTLAIHKQPLPAPPKETP